MPKISIINIKFLRKLSLVVFLVLHASWLLIIRSQMNPDVIFPSWLLSNSNNLVSEVLTMYPPLLFYIVSFVNNITHNLFISSTIIQLTLMLLVDSFLFYYLNKKFGFKFAVYGLVFYIPWQVFFRGNYLWHDFATIPFVIFSFFYFEKYVTRQTPMNLLIASTFLASGYLFKLTVVYIYVLYFIWVIIFTFKNPLTLIKNTLILFCPLIFAVLVNFMIILSRSTLEFTFYWNIIMQIFIYPRLPALSRPINLNYYPVLGLLMIIFVISCYTILKHSKVANRNKLFLFSFALFSLANIFPRWSDFHLQLFLVPLTIVATYTFFLGKKLMMHHKNYFFAMFSFIIFFSLILFWNRIIAEMKASKTTEDDYISKFAPSRKLELIRDKNVFIYDYALYDDKLPFDSGRRPGIAEQLFIGLSNPDYFHHSTSWQKAFGYIESNRPETILIPYQIKNKIDANNDLTSFEKFLIRNYHPVDTIADYFVYEINEVI